MFSLNTSPSNVELQLAPPSLTLHNYRAYTIRTNLLRARSNTAPNPSSNVFLGAGTYKTSYYLRYTLQSTQQQTSDASILLSSPLSQLCAPPLSSSPHIVSIMDHDNNNKRKRNTEPTPEDFVLIGKDIQNKSGRSIGSAAEEERAFCEFFGTTAPVVTAL